MAFKLLLLLLQAFLLRLMARVWKGRLATNAYDFGTRQGSTAAVLRNNNKYLILHDDIERNDA